MAGTSYTYLGQRGPVTAGLDTTGVNPGNWTVVFTPAVLQFRVPECFVYKMNVKGPLGSSFNVAIETQIHDVNIFGNQNSWYDDADQLVLRPGENLYLQYNAPFTYVGDPNTPIAWIFLRYDYTKWGAQMGDTVRTAPKNG